MTVVFHRLSILILCLLGFYVRARGARDKHIIYPREDLSLLESVQFTEHLIELAGPEGNVYTSRNPGHWHLPSETINFWWANVNSTIYEVLRNDPRVSDIHLDLRVVEPFSDYASADENSTHLFRPTSEMTLSNSSAQNLVYVTQRSPLATELRALSQPALSGSISQYPNYVYPVGGIPSYIYHVELGINQQHSDFIRRNVEWLYTGFAIHQRVNTTTEATAGMGHSTCTASKAAGNLYGASKSATLVVVKMPGLNEASVYEVLDTVIDDITDKHREKTSVVSISWGSIGGVTPAFIESPLGRRLRNQIHVLIDMGVLIVCAAGEAAQARTPAGGLRTFVDTYPALLAGSTPSWAGQFFVVGNSDINGVRYPTSQLSQNPTEPQVYAPGVQIKCACSTASRGYMTGTGNSFSAPLVAGVLADLLSTGQYVPGRPVWWKRPGGENVIWNLVRNADNPPNPLVFGNDNATLVNYTSSVLTTTNLDTNGLDNEQLEQLDLSTD